MSVSWRSSPRLDPPPNGVAPELILLFHPFVELALAVGIVEKHLLEEVKVTGIGQLSGHLLPLDIAQPHDLGHGMFHTLDVFVDEIAQRPSDGANLFAGSWRWKR